MRVSAEESFTSSLRSLGLTTWRSTACGGGGTAICASSRPRRAYRRCALLHLAEADGLARRGGAALGGLLADHLKMPETLPISPRGACSSMPSSTLPASTRTTESFPAWLVWIVFITCSRVLAVFGDAEPLARVLDIRRLVAERLQEPHDAVAVERGADQHRHDLPGAQLGGEVGEDLVARRLDVLQQLLHQRVVVIGEALEHRVARLVARATSRRGSSSIISLIACSR